MKMRSYIAILLAFSMLCYVTLFVFSYRFVNAQTTPKWLGLMLCVGVMGIAWGIAGRKIKTLSSQHLFGTVTVFALALSLLGILQHVGVAHKGMAIGNFDNPAGFASALVCAFPLSFLFFKSSISYRRYATVVAAVIMAIAVFLSGSRAGMLAMAVVTVVWLLVKIRQRTLRIALLALLVTLPIVLYFFKKDSADGRLLIWRCTIDMVADRPLVGHGHGAFRAKYMLYQAAHFDANPDSRYALLADNVQHPFNEYLLILAEYGIVGLCLIAIAVFLLTKAYRKNSSLEKFPVVLSLFALTVFSFFSYPFRYPFTWLLLFVNVAVICYPTVKSRAAKIKEWLPLRIAVSLLSVVLLTYTVVLAQAEIRWKRIANLSLSGRTAEVLSQYEKLYQRLGNDWLFLYNHAAELHEVGDYEKSLAIFERCTRYFNDMDVQMLQASSYEALGKHAEVEQHLKIAANMCPSRLMPLYKLAKLYSATDREEEARAMALLIVDKEVKVPTSTANAIKNEMRRMLEVQEPDNPVPKNRRCEKGKIWRDKMPP